MRSATPAIALLALSACQPLRAPEPVPIAEPEDPQAVLDRQLDSLVDPPREGRYAPRDECGELDGAREFRLALASALRDRDRERLGALFASEVKLDFGGGSRRAEFLRRLEDPQYRLAEELAALLPLGCAASSDDEFILPWIAGQNAGEDPFTAMWVLGNDVPVHASASADSEVLDRLDWAVVELAQEHGMDGEFKRIRYGNGGFGHVAADKLRSVIDYRLIAGRQHGLWRAEVFIAGD